MEKGGGVSMQDMMTFLQTLLLLHTREISTVVNLAASFLRKMVTFYAKINYFHCVFWLHSKNLSEKSLQKRHPEGCLFDTLFVDFI